jgi:hypothetical protein
MTRLGRPLSNKNQKILNYKSAIIDCDYTIARLLKDGKLDQIKHVEQYKQDLLKLIEKQGV